MNTDPHIAVVLIHGIGDLRRLDVLESAKSAVVRLAPEARFEECTDFSSDSTQQVTIDAASALVAGQRTTLVEFYWAQIVGKIRATRPVHSYFMFFDIFWSAPMLAIQGYGHERARFYFARAVASWLCLCLAALPLIAAWALIEQSVYWVNHCREGLSCLFRGLFTGPIFHSTSIVEIYLPILMFTLLLVLVLACQWVVSEGIALFRPLKAGAPAFWRVMFICGALSVVIMIGFYFLVSAAYVVTEGVLSYYFPYKGLWGNRDIEKSMLEVASAVWPSVLGLVVSLTIATTVGNLVRDVVYYLAPDGGGGLRPHQLRIQVALWKLIEKIQSSGASKIVLVAHSLGTVILIDTLLKHVHGASRSPRDCPIHIVTAGSPIRRLILRLVPHRLKDLPAIIEELSKATAFRVASWKNTYRLFDYVGQALGHTALLKKMPNVPYDESGWFQDRPLRPLWRHPFFHSNYWGDSRFAEVVALKAIAPEAPSDHERVISFV
jgi:hypothetical protein